MFPQWTDCEKMSTRAVSNEEIPRHFRAMINCVLFQRSKENEFIIVTEDEELVSIAAEWGLKTTTTSEIDIAISSALEKYHQEMKAYETNKRNATRNTPSQSLWTPK
jgi:predicted nuclease of predicted toxin-antitoxin system